MTTSPRASDPIGARRALEGRRLDEITIGESLVLQQCDEIQTNGVARDVAWLGVGYDRILNYRPSFTIGRGTMARALAALATRLGAKTTGEAFPGVRDHGTCAEAQTEDGVLQVEHAAIRYFLELEAQSASEPRARVVVTLGGDRQSEVLFKVVDSPAGRAALGVLEEGLRAEVLGLLRNLADAVLDSSGEVIRDAKLRRVTWDDVVLSPAKREELRLATEFLRDAERFKRYGLPLRRTVLLSGPPGVGKSTAISAILNEMSAMLRILVLPGDFADSDSRRGIFGRVFRTAETLKEPAVIVWEDCDTYLGGGSKDSPLSAFLHEMDGLLSRFDIPICNIMTTNFPEKLGEAAQRKGRIDVHISFDLPAAEERRRMLRLFLGDSFELPEDLDAIADQMKKASGADLREVSIRARFFAVERVSSPQGPLGPAADAAANAGAERAKPRITGEDLRRAAEFVAEERRTIGFGAS